MSDSIGPGTGTITSKSASATSIEILAANTNRKGATVTNDGAANLYLALSSATASATVFTVIIPPGKYYEFPVVDGGVYIGAVNGIWSSASGSARITEFT